MNEHHDRPPATIVVVGLGGIGAGIAHRLAGASVAGGALATLSDNQLELLVEDTRLLVRQLGSSPFAILSSDDAVPLVGAARDLLAHEPSQGAHR